MIMSIKIIDPNIFTLLGSEPWLVPKTVKTSSLQLRLFLMAPHTNLQEIASRISDCTSCRLSEKRSQTVPGSGDANAQIMFIGEAPGFNEDKNGHPFVGRAGNLLDQLLGLIGLDRDKVFITNMVKCRPPDNRDPQNDELKSCSTYINDQIKALSPKVIVTLGRFSFGKFFPRETITQSRGIVRKWNNIDILPMYHPAAALYNPSLRPRLEKDFQKLLELTGSSKYVVASPTSESEIEEERQLGLFD